MLRVFAAPAIHPNKTHKIQGLKGSFPDHHSPSRTLSPRWGFWRAISPTSLFMPTANVAMLEDFYIADIEYLGEEEKHSVLRGGV